jgi:hypothetical protein
MSSLLKHIRLGATVIGCLGIIGISEASALQYRRVPLKPPAVAILARGPIVTGDFQRLGDFAGTMQSTDRIIGIFLDSPGGNILEAEKIAGVIKSFDMTAMVSSGSECSSACFLLFAAASRRIVDPDALIGIHSASERGQETLTSMAVTTAMARDAAGFGVPDAIIGKLVQTPPGRTTWLTPSDLASMRVRVFEEVGTTAPQAPVTLVPQQANPASPPLTSYSAGYEQKSPAFEQGTADRRAWEAWLGGLSGSYRDGAEYWSAQRSTPRPGSCYGPAGENLGDWTTGCLAAKRFLTPTDTRRKAEPEYRAGWNSYSG